MQNISESGSNSYYGNDSFAIMDPPCYDQDLSSAGSSSPISPTLSSPMTPGFISISPHDSSFAGSPPMFSDIKSKASLQKPTKVKKNNVSTFIKKLYSMVNDKKHQDLISWNPNGRSFFIYNSKRFSKQVLPEHFKHGNFSSFVRQLNMYGFRKINKASRGKHGTDQNEVWEFYHPQFQRDGVKELSDIKRKAANSEMLRRDTGDIHVSVQKVQTDQKKLLDQFHVLQDNFSSLWQGYEDLRKNQSDLQSGIDKLNYLHEEHQQQQQQTVPAFTSLPVTPGGIDSSNRYLYDDALKSPLPPSPIPDTGYIDPGKLCK